MHRYKKLQYYSVETVYFSPLFIVAQCFCINVFERCVIKRCRWTIDLWNLIQTQERPVIIQIEVLRGVKDLAFCLGLQFFMNMWPEEVKCTWMTVKIAAKLEGKWVGFTAWGCWSLDAGKLCIMEIHMRGVILKTLTQYWNCFQWCFTTSILGDRARIRQHV